MYVRSEGLRTFLYVFMGVVSVRKRLWVNAPVAIFITFDYYPFMYSCRAAIALYSPSQYLRWGL